MTDEEDNDDTPPIEMRGGARRESPMTLDLPDCTDAHELFTRDPNDGVRAAIDALEFDGDGPATRRAVFTVWEAATRHLGKHAAAIQQVATRQRLADKRDAKGRRWINRAIWSALSAAALSIGGLVGIIWHRANQEGGDAVRLQRAVDDLKEQGHRLDEVDRSCQMRLNQLSEELFRHRPTSHIDNPTPGLRAPSALALKGTP